MLETLWSSPKFTQYESQDSFRPSHNLLLLCFALLPTVRNASWVEMQGKLDELYVSLPITETSIVSKPIDPFKPANDKKDGLYMYIWNLTGKIQAPLYHTTWITLHHLALVNISSLFSFANSLPLSIQPYTQFSLYTPSPPLFTHHTHSTPPPLPPITHTL